MKKLTALFCALALTLSPAAAVAKAPSPTAEPPAAPPVRIASAEEFIAFARDCALDTYSLGRTFSLEADIDLTGTDFAPVPYFAGTFLGNGRQIRGLEITADGSRMGLFRQVAEGAVVQDLRVSGLVAPGGTGVYVGGVAGLVNGTLKNCSFEGSVRGVENTGGVAGAVGETGALRSCAFRGDVAAEHQSGGVAGENRGLIQGCSAAGNVNTVLITPRTEPGFDVAAFSQDDFLDLANIGGIVGSNAGVIADSRNTAAVGYKNTGYNVGGVAGISTGYITECENQGDVTGRRDVGGITGQLIPYTVWSYGDGRLDALEKELNSLSYLVSSASGAAGRINDKLGKTLDGVQSDTQKAIKELKKLMNNLKDVGRQLRDIIHRDPDTGEITIDRIDVTGLSTADLTAALSDLHGRYVTLTTQLDDAMDTLIDGFGGISGQLSRVMGTMFSTMEEMSGSSPVSTRDLSVEETYDHDLGAVDRCVNYAAVTADNNAGGVAGTVGFEVSFDMEDRLNVSGLITADAEQTVFAALRRCSSYAAVTARESRAGGVAGNMDVGVAAECAAAGSVTAQTGDYAGGIAGFSAGTVRGCWARSELTGNKYVGGVAGRGTDLTSCRAWAHVAGASEFVGSVAGWAEGELYDNLYVPDAPAGVDGVALHGRCDPVDREKLLDMDGAPESFDALTVTFLAGEEIVEQVRVDFGGGIDTLPPVPNDGERYWKWDEAQLDHIYRSLTVTGRYYAPGTVLSWGGDPAEFLAEGVFYEGQALTVTPLSLPGDEEALGAWSLQVEGYEGELTVRMRAEDGGTVYRITESGREKLSSRTDGQYIVFALPNGGAFLLLPESAETSLPPWAVGVGLAALFAGALAAVLLRRKKRAPAEGTTAGT